MRKFVTGVVLAAALALFAGAAHAADAATPGKAANPVDQFTGKYWVNTQETSKEAYLYGIESAIEVEYFINSRLAADSAKAGKKPAFTLSPFEKGWMEAFRDTTRKQIVSEVDKWYSEHPEQLDRPVLAVIWHELIAPRLKK